MSEHPHPAGRLSILKPDGDGGAEGTITRGVGALAKLALYAVLLLILAGAAVAVLFTGSAIGMIVGIAAGVALVVLTAALVMQFREERPRRMRR
jgi:hypothetical protein